MVQIPAPIVALIIVGIIVMYSAYVKSKSDHVISIDGINYKISMKYDEDSYGLAVQRLTHINQMLINLTAHLRNKYIRQNYGSERERRWAYNIWRRFDPSSITENVPMSTKNTSWVRNKGEEMSLCLREKQSGKNLIHDKGILEFVALHEVSHIAEDNYGHELNSFWPAFKFILTEAKEAGVHTPIDYAKTPTRYCGILVPENPYFQ